MTNLHKAIVAMHKAIAGHHERCAKALDSHARGCVLGDAHAAVFRVLADEHKAIAAHHGVAAAELESSPEVQEFGGRSGQPSKSADMFFMKSAERAAPAREGYPLNEELRRVSRTATALAGSICYRNRNQMPRAVGFQVSATIYCRLIECDWKLGTASVSSSKIGITLCERNTFKISSTRPCASSFNSPPPRLREMYVCTTMPTPELSMRLRFFRFSNNFRLPVTSKSRRRLLSASPSPPFIVNFPNRSNMLISPLTRIEI